MTPLRQRMIDAMVLRGFSPRTQQSYADAIQVLEYLSRYTHRTAISNERIRSVMGQVD